MLKACLLFECDLSHHEMAERRIGQRRDATRAPSRARKRIGPEQSGPFYDPVPFASISGLYALNPGGPGAEPLAHGWDVLPPLAQTFVAACSEMLISPTDSGGQPTFRGVIFNLISKPNTRQR